MTHGKLSEEAVDPWTIDTYSQILKITRKVVVNDDFSLFDTIPVMQAKAAARALSDLIWATIRANAGSFFSTGNGNYQQRAETALSLTSLEDLATLMRKQRNAAAMTWTSCRKRLVVAPENEITARAILNSDLIQAAEGSLMGNVLQNIANVEVESRISNSDKFTGGIGEKVLPVRFAGRCSHHRRIPRRPAISDRRTVRALG